MTAENRERKKKRMSKWEKKLFLWIKERTWIEKKKRKKKKDCKFLEIKKNKLMIEK